MLPEQLFQKSEAPIGLFHRRGENQVPDRHRPEQRDRVGEALNLTGEAMERRVRDLENSSGDGRVLLDQAADVIDGRVRVVDGLHDLAGDRRHGRQASFAGREIALESIAHERVGSIGSARSAAPRIQKQNTPGRPPGSFRPGLELSMSIGSASSCRARVPLGANQLETTRRVPSREGQSYERPEKRGGVMITPYSDGPSSRSGRIREFRSLRRSPGSRRHYGPDSRPTRDPLPERSSRRCDPGNRRRSRIRRRFDRGRSRLRL